MFNWSLFVVLVLAAVPGVLISMPGLADQMQGLAASKSDGRTPPSKRLIVVAGTAQTLLLVAAAAAAGVALTPRVGLSAPFFATLAQGRPSLAVVQAQLVAALGLGVAGALLFIALYYLLFRPRLDEATVQAMEGLRMQLGIGSRVLYGGVVEEILVRWGLMTLFAWLGLLVTGAVSAPVMWTAVVLAGILFGIGHLPTYLAAGCRVTPWFLTAMLGLNLWASLIFGWLFWQHGLLAAMIGHALFHLIWLPFDRAFYRPAPRPVKPQF